MRIQIKNLGNVENGLFDISKRLTVFCGPNNTGKTYVSYIVYSMLKSQYFFSNVTFDDYSSVLVDGEMTIDLKETDILKYREKKLESLMSSLESVFGISDNDKLSLFKELSIRYDDSAGHFAKQIKQMKLDFSFEWNGIPISIKKESGHNSVVVSRPSDITPADLDDSYFFSWQLNSVIYEMIVNYPYSKSSIFPVERNSIYTFNKELSIQRNELIEQMQALKDNRKIGRDSVDRLLGRSTRYPLAIRDCLSVANDLTNLKKQKSDYSSFADNLENQLLGGKISVTKEGDVEFVPKRGQRLPIHLSASIVKTLSSLTFYLRHLAEKGDLIIIDEPEMNLHPDAQIVLTHLFGRLVNQGLNLLISTHSDYIIRELNNMISLGSIVDREGVMRELDYCEEEVLHAEDIAVYLFKPKRSNSRISVIEQVKVNEDGFCMQTIDEVISQLNTNSDRIDYKLRYNE